MTDQAIVAIKERVKHKFKYLCDPDVDVAFDMALGDYLLIKYPSDNNRPLPENVQDSFVVSQWLYKRIIDILERAGMNLKSYSENGLRFEYASGNIDSTLVAELMPKAGVPK